MQKSDIVTVRLTDSPLQIVSVELEAAIIGASPIFTVKVVEPEQPNESSPITVYKVETVGLATAESPIVLIAISGDQVYIGAPVATIATGGSLGHRSTVAGTLKVTTGSGFGLTSTNNVVLVSVTPALVHVT